MGGVQSGVQQRIKELEPRTLYLHSASHNLKLVVPNHYAENSVRD